MCEEKNAHTPASQGTTCVTLYVVYGAHASERQMQMGDIFSLFCVYPHMYVAGQLAALIRVLAHAAPEECFWG